MNRPLRRRHRALFVLLSLVVPAGYSAALVGRRPPPPPSPWPTSQPRTTGPERVAEWPTLDLRMRLRRTVEGALVVQAESWEQPAPPATLLYWSASEPLDGALPSAARFVGALGGPSHALVLPPEAVGGWLVLFSLGHGEVLGTLALEEAR